MKKTALLLIVLTIISKFIGLGREVTLSYFYGASYISDSYIIALTIPTVIFAIIGQAITTGYIPLYSRIENEHGVKNANKYTNNLINILLILCTIIVLISLLFTEQIVKVFASGFEGETLTLAVNFTRISLFGMYFTLLVHIFKAFLQIKGSFTAPGLVGLPLNLFLILFIIISSKGDLSILAIGIVVSIASQLLFLYPFIRRKGFKYKFYINIRDNNIKNMLLLALPIIVAVAVNDVNKIVDRTLASQIVEGGISALNYSNQLNRVVQGIVVLSIATAMYPMISKMAIKKDIVGLKKTTSEAITAVNLLVIPATIGLAILAEPIVAALFGRGAFDDEAIYLTSNALFFYSIGMIGFGLREVLSRPFYAMQDVKTPMINATIGVLLNIILNIVLSKFMGINGLALATSLSGLFTAGLMFISLRKKIGSFTQMLKMLISFIKILLSSLAMGLVIKQAFNNFILITTQNLSLTLSISVGLITYFALIYLLKVEEFVLIINAIKKKR